MALIRTMEQFAATVKIAVSGDISTLIKISKIWEIMEQKDGKGVSVPFSLTFVKKSTPLHTLSTHRPE